MSCNVTTTEVNGKRERQSILSIYNPLQETRVSNTEGLSSLIENITECDSPLAEVSCPKLIGGDLLSHLLINKSHPFKNLSEK